MLSLTTRTSYGVAAVLELAKKREGELTQAKTIAARRDIPMKYLEQILGQASRAKLVRAVRGVHGGYELARPPAEITVLELLQALETKAPSDPADSVVPKVLADLLRKAEAAAAHVFKVSVKELSEREQVQDAAMYHI